MSKGAVIAATVVGAAVVLGLVGYASASTKKVILPDLGAPPPPPPPDTLGSALVKEGGKILDEVGKNEYVQAYTGGSYGSYAKDALINPYYAAGKGGVRVAKKIWNAIF